MNITLKNIKHAEFASHETYCFEASVYVDGKRMFTVENDGHGGCHNFHAIAGMTHKECRDHIAEIDKVLNKEIIKGDIFDLTNDLELEVSNQVTNWLIDKDIKRTLKKACYVRDGMVFVVDAKPTAAVFEKIKKQKWWKPEYVILNTLPIEEIRQYFK